MDESPNIEIVPASDEDAAMLALISQRAYENAAEKHDKKLGGPRGYKSAKDQLYYIERLETYNIMYDEIIVGGIVVAENGFGIKEIVRIFVDPDFQRNGIGSKSFAILIEKSEASAWTCGTIAWNEINQNFLNKNGFERIGLIKGDEQQIWYQKTLRDLELPEISELNTKMNRVVVEGEIVEKSMARAVRSRRPWETLLVAEATLKDSSDDVVLMLWNEQIKQCVVGDRVRIEGGYVKNYRGIRQLNVGKVGKLITLD